MDLNMIGVVGAGVMGAGIAQDLAHHNLNVILIDKSPEALEVCHQQIQQNLRLYRLFRKEATPSSEETLSRITFSTDATLLAGADFLIETVTETWDAKLVVYESVEQICRDDIVFASNTSAIPIWQIASLTRRLDRVIGLHFMNPSPLQQTVEVVMSEQTTSATLQVTQELLVRLGKTWIIVKDRPGFVSNRVLMLAINEAIMLVEENAASVEEIDQIFTRCLHHKMGPLATADLIGLDTVLHTLEVLRQHLNNDKYAPAPLLQKLVNAGQLGRKSGQGFHNYELFS